MILDCQNISKAFGTNVILDNVSFHLEDKEKMAIVGINGAGKTTLLKIIMQEEEADSGQIVLSKDRTIGYLSQHQDIFYDDTVYGVMEDAMKPVIELQDKIRKLEQDMTTLTGDELKSALSTYNRYTHEFEYKNGYAYESEITGVLKGLGFSKEDFDRHTDTLSGGQKTRLSLGRLLLTKPDIIILDEPTNHLDMDSISWLETFLTGYQGSVILVSHDRYFVNKTCTRILELTGDDEQIELVLAPPDLWNKQSQTGRSTADTFDDHGLYLTKVSNDRINGWFAMKEWLRVVPDEQGEPTAKLRIFNTCQNLIRCIPALQYDEKIVNDAAKQPHEITHSNDAIRYFCVYWTYAATIPEEKDEDYVDYDDGLSNFMNY